MGRPARKVITDPYQAVHEKARSYQKKGRIQVHVFSKFRSECVKLAYVFGGGAYRHRAGWLWILSNRDDVMNLVRKMDEAGKLPSVNQFENPILTLYINPESR